MNPELFTRYTSQSQAPIAIQAIPDASLPLKVWAWDEAISPLPAADADGNIDYFILPAPGGQFLQKAKCPASIIHKLNMPGTPVFPAYVIGKTEAVIVGELVTGATATAPLPENRLSTLDQADALAAEFTAAAKAQNFELPHPFIVTERDTLNETSWGNAIDYKTETRRVYVVSAGAGAPEVNVGEWLEMANSRGVGRPIAYKFTAESLTPALPVTFLPLNDEPNLELPSYPAPVAPLDPTKQRILWYQTMFDSRWIAEYVNL